MTLTAFIERRSAVALALILFLGLAVRVYLLPVSGFSLDLEQHYDWALCANEDLFAVYDCPTDPTRRSAPPCWAFSSA